MRNRSKAISPQRLREVLPARPQASATALTRSPVQIDAYADYGPAELDVPALDHHFLLLQVDGVTRFTQKRAGSVFESEWRPGDLSLMPAGRSSQWAWNTPTGTLQLYIPTVLVQRVVEDACGVDGARIELLDRFRFDDPLLRELGMAIRKAMHGDSVLGPAYLEGLANALVLQLVARHSVIAPRVERGAGRRLPIDRLRRVRDLIEHGLTAREMPRLDALAATAGYSVHHFCRLFKASTGLPPHAYLQQRRLDRARELLLTTQLPLKSIAATCGFYDQGHFTRAFKLRFGIAPSSARGAMRRFVQD